MFHTVFTSVLPLIKQKYPNQIRLLFRHQIQPWHPSSTLLHESALALGRLAPEHFWTYSAALFAAAPTSFYDVPLVNTTRNDVYAQLVDLATSTIPGFDGAAMLALLRVPDVPRDPAGRADAGRNPGNGVTDDLKLVVKMGRQTGIHVSPTVLVNGLVENGIESSFSPAQWEQYLEKLVK